MNLRKLLLLFIALTLSSCTDSITQTHLLNDSEEAVFIPFESQGILTVE